MPIKEYGPGASPEVHRWPGGVTWFAHPGETMRRASHALVIGDDRSLATTAPEPAEGDVWLVEPIDAAGLDDILEDLGQVAGVVVLAELHRRDAETIATRHDVPIFLPERIATLGPTLDARVSVFTGTLPGTSFRAIPVLDGVPWSESVLHDPESGTLVATEVLVTSDRTTGWGERLAVGPYARLQPPRAALSDRHVERVLVGHGEPLATDARAALDRALARSVRGLPAYLLKDALFMLRAGYVALRD